MEPSGSRSRRTSAASTPMEGMMSRTGAGRLSAVPSGGGAGTPRLPASSGRSEGMVGGHGVVELDQLDRLAQATGRYQRVHMASRCDEVLDRRDHVQAPAVAHLDVVDALGKLSVPGRLHEPELQEVGVEPVDGEV